MFPSDLAPHPDAPAPSPTATTGAARDTVVASRARRSPCGSPPRGGTAAQGVAAASLAQPCSCGGLPFPGPPAHCAAAASIVQPCPGGGAPPPAARRSSSAPGGSSDAAAESGSAPSGAAAPPPPSPSLPPSRTWGWAPRAYPRRPSQAAGHPRLRRGVSRLCPAALRAWQRAAAARHQVPPPSRRPPFPVLPTIRGGWGLYHQLPLHRTVPMMHRWWPFLPSTWIRRARLPRWPEGEGGRAPRRAASSRIRARTANPTPHSHAPAQGGPL